MGRPRIEIPVPALALRRAEAAAACGVSLETFDLHIRPHVAGVQLGTVVVYPRAELERFLSEKSTKQRPGGVECARPTKAPPHR